MPAPELPGLGLVQQGLGCLETEALSVASERVAWGDRNTSWYFTVTGAVLNEHPSECSSLCCEPWNSWSHDEELEQ